MRYIYNTHDIYNIKTFRTLNANVWNMDIQKLCDIAFLLTYQKILTKNKMKSNILLVEVDGDACVDPHNKKGEARQDKQL